SHSQALTVSTRSRTQRLLAGRQALGRWDLALTTRQSAAGHIMRLLRLQAHTRMPFIIARKTWSQRFVCAAIMEAPASVLPSQPIRPNVAVCTATERSAQTGRFTFRTTAPAGSGPATLRHT